MGQYGQEAQFEIKKAYLSDKFGYDLAVKWFGQEEVDKLPVQEKGKNAGKPQGLVEWYKCVAGGYHPFYYQVSGKVETRKGWVLGKALIKTEWNFNYKLKKGIPTNTIVKQDGEYTYEMWVC